MLKKKFTPSNLIKYIEFDNGKKLYLIKHSEDAIVRRNISEDDIIDTFLNSDMVVPNKDYENARNYIKHFTKNLK
ncbi:MAG: hypothetical protein ABFS56_12305 [Pseudomonadota bacterium]